MRIKFFSFIFSMVLISSSFSYAQDVDLKDAKESLKEKKWLTRRGISQYVHYLIGNVKELMDLNEHDHVLDLGAGQAIFSRELAGMLNNNNYEYPQFQTREQWQIPKLTLVTFENHNLGNFTEKYNPLVGRLFEEIPTEELLRLGKINRVYELWGVLAYTYHPILVLRKLYFIMEDKGIYIAKTGQRFSNRPDCSRMHASVVRNDSTVISIVDWLKINIKGFNVSIINEGHPYEAIQFVKDESVAFDAPDLVFIGHDSGCEPKPRIFDQITPQENQKQHSRL